MFCVILYIVVYYNLLMKGKRSIVNLFLLFLGRMFIYNIIFFLLF